MILTVFATAITTARGRCTGYDNGRLLSPPHHTTPRLLSSPRSSPATILHRRLSASLYLLANARGVEHNACCLNASFIAGRMLRTRAVAALFGGRFSRSKELFMFYGWAVRSRSSGDVSPPVQFNAAFVYGSQLTFSVSLSYFCVCLRLLAVY